MSIHRLAIEKIASARPADSRAARPPDLRVAPGDAAPLRQISGHNVERRHGRSGERRQGVTELKRSVLLVAAGIATISVAWLLAVTAFHLARFAVSMPRAQVAVASVGAVCQIFAAMVLFIMPPTRERQRLRWLAGGLLILGTVRLCVVGSQEVFGTGVPNVNTALYLTAAVQLVACVLFVGGLVGRTPREYTWRVALATLGSALGLSGLLVIFGRSLPPLVTLQGVGSAVDRSYGALPGMSEWHWFLSSLALCLALLATVAAARWCQDGILGLWLLAGTALWSASLFHALYWPGGYGQVVTTSDILRLGFSLVVAVGAVVELRKLAQRRVTKLALEEEHARKLSELAVLKANFTAMVAHELGSPLGAIRGYVDMLETNELKQDERAEALQVIHAEIDALTSLVRDVQTAASVEREDFVVRPRPVSLASILGEAAAFAKTLPGNHPFRTTLAVHEMVWADPERIRQVLRNLLTNAGKYTPAGVQIELTATRYNEVVRLEVIDHGPGIRHEDVGRIFEKFGRGRDHAGRKVPGVGLGLYLSRRIIQAHGSMLTVASRIEGGSVFGFELEVIL